MMFQRLISYLSTWLGNEAEQATYSAIKSGAQRGAQRAFFELTGDNTAAVELFAVEAIPSTPQQHLDSQREQPVQNSAPLPPMFTRSEIHSLKRDELLSLVEQHGWQVDTTGNMKTIREAVFQELGI